MASYPKVEEPVVDSLVALVIYSTLFSILPHYTQATALWQGLPQFYFLAAALWIAKRERITFADLGWQRAKVGRELLIGLAAAALPLAVTAAVWSGVPSSPSPLPQSNYWNPAGGLQLIVLVVLAPFSEELFFRGILTRQLLKYLPKVLVWLLVSLLFAAAHFRLEIGPLLLGLGTTALFIWRRSMIAGLVVHVVCNALAPVLVVFAPKVYFELRHFFL